MSCLKRRKIVRWITDIEGVDHFGRVDQANIGYTKPNALIGTSNWEVSDQEHITATFWNDTLTYWL